MSHAEEFTDPAVVIEDLEHWAKVPEALAYDHGIGDKAVRVFVCLYRHGADPDSCYPSNERIAELIGCSPKSIARPLLELLERGWVRRFPRRSASGMRSANGYAIALDPARARRNAASFARNEEPAALRTGRERKAAERAAELLAAPSAQESANAPSALRSATGSRSGARQARALLREEREPLKESQGKRETPLPPAEADGRLTPSAQRAGRLSAPGEGSSVSRRRSPVVPPAPVDHHADTARAIADRVSSRRRPAPMANVREQMVVYKAALGAGWTAEQVEAAAMEASTITTGALELQLNRGAGTGQRLSPGERRRAERTAERVAVVAHFAAMTGEPDPNAPTPDLFLNAVTTQELHP